MAVNPESANPAPVHPTPAISTPKPLATYTERLLEVRREFSLYKDRVVVEAQWRFKNWRLNKRFEHVVKLATLRAEIREVTVRYRMYRYAGWVLAVGALAFAVAYYKAAGGALANWGYIALGVLILGAVCVAVTYPNRRVHFARFMSKSGVAGLDIGCAGNDVAVFKKFVEQVRRQISLREQGML
ncbi:MAG: hypothetical protein ACYC3X_11345 [Pirellulaceae bacterium]